MLQLVRMLHYELNTNDTKPSIASNMVSVQIAGGELMECCACYLLEVEVEAPTLCGHGMTESALNSILAILPAMGSIIGKYEKFMNKCEGVG